MNAFPLALDTLLKAEKAKVAAINEGEFEPGASQLKQQALAESNAKIKQYEQQQGQSGPTYVPTIQPMVRRGRSVVPTTEVAGIAVPLAGDDNNDYSTLAADTVADLDAEQLDAIAKAVGALDFPAELEAKREYLKKAIEGGQMKPEVVSLRKKRNLALQAIETASPAEVIDNYGPDVLDLVWKYAHVHQDGAKKPKKIGTGDITTIKEALVKKRELEASLKAGGDE